ncbi:hypothetical protein LJR245_007557 [Rhizobium leguminosarum]|uniref:hypothetical protein n=1 Tax=Rhizobium leguminosarum TaxID=384 RepID=UPI003ECE5792
METIWIAFYDFGTVRFEPPKIILECCGEMLRRGSNGLLITSDCLRVRAVHTDAKRTDLYPHLEFELAFITEDQARRTKNLSEQLKKIAPGYWSEDLIPLVAIAEEVSGSPIYFVTERTMVGTFALCFSKSSDISAGSDFAALSKAIGIALSTSDERLPLLNSRSAYFKWNPEMELERKFTFKVVPDIWRLATKLHKQLHLGFCSNFIPEPHMGFQVWDYENYPFEITQPAEEAGYVSFIPQVDGRTTIKRKWFVENAEMRREVVLPGQIVEDYNVTALKLTMGTVNPLAPFNRTRFDINYESLATGHVYGIYFDICTTVSIQPQRVFGQVEVEYCRTRTALAIHDIWPEFNVLTQYVREYLENEDVDFEQNLYSKLDFAREAAIAKNGWGGHA